LQFDGLTAELSEGGCSILARKAPVSEGTEVLLEITKDGALLRTQATVLYNLKDEIIGLRFADMPPDRAAILAAWIKAATLSLEQSQRDA
jgi:hypothetical protein